jgi:CBS domain-containing protein
MSALVSELLTGPAVTVSEEESVERARELCRLHNLHFLVVVRGDQPCGLTCVCDLCWAWRGSSVADVMLRSAVAVRLDQSPREAAALMCEHGKGALVVVDATGKVSGVITRRDLIESGMPDERGVTSCATCGDADHLLDAECPGAPAFCGVCLEEVRYSGVPGSFLSPAGGSTG